MSRIRACIDQFLGLGAGVDADSSSYHVQVVNLSYLLTFAAFLILFLPSLQLGNPFLIVFEVLSLGFLLFGLYLNINQRQNYAAILFPVIVICNTSIKTMIFYGVESQLHWFLAVIGVYVYTAFSREIRHWRLPFLALSVVIFVLCHAYPGRAQVIMLPEQQVIVRYLTFVITLAAISGATALVVGRLRRANSELRKLAELDELTGIANRRKVLADAVNIYADAVINMESCVYAIVDLDHFKKINDTYGHEAGDVVLKSVAAKMDDTIRKGDKLGRYGGEEFVVIMPDTDITQGLQEMDRLRQEVSDMLIETEMGVVVPVTLSVGLSAISLETNRYEEILAEADSALYSAKREGRNRVSAYTSF